MTYKRIFNEKIKEIIPPRIMKIDEIFAMELHNDTCIHLVKDGGLFYRAYEKSAYQFCQFFEKCKLLYRHFKNIGEDVVWLGFPTEKIPQIKQEATNLHFVFYEDEPGHYVIAKIPPIENFESWKRSVVAANQNKASVAQPSANVAEPLPSASSAPAAAPKPIPRGRLFSTYKEVFDYAKFIYLVTGKFHKDFKYEMGAELRRLSTDVLQKLQVSLMDLAPLDSTACFMLVLRSRILFRLAFELRQMSERQWMHGIQKILKIEKSLRPESASISPGGASRLESRNPLQSELGDPKDHWLQTVLEVTGEEE